MYNMYKINVIISVKCEMCNHKHKNIFIIIGKLILKFVGL